MVRETVQVSLGNSRRKRNIPSQTLPNLNQNRAQRSLSKPQAEVQPAMEQEEPVPSRTALTRLQPLIGILVASAALLAVAGIAIALLSRREN